MDLEGEDCEGSAAMKTHKRYASRKPSSSYCHGTKVWKYPRESAAGILFRLVS